MSDLELLPLRFRLFHGRQDPAQQMDDWGTDGPVFPASFVHTTYGHYVRLGGPEHGETHLELYVSEDGLVFYDGVWYGDWTVYPPEAEPDLPISVCDQSKASIPNSIRSKRMKDFEKRIAAAAQRTWQAIGGDILQAAEADSVIQEEVIEAVMDYIQDYGRDKEAVTEFNRLSFEDKTEMLRKAFPLSRYGW